MKEKTTVLRAVIALTAMAALPIVAFDWKPKPTVQLKADFVAYVRTIGETNLADRVEGAVGTAEWMRIAIQRGTELLKASEGCDFNDKRRERCHFEKCL